MDCEPPLLESYKTLLQSSLGVRVDTDDVRYDDKSYMVVESYELPLIDLNPSHLKREELVKEITEASRDWGFFQVVNHGIPEEVLQNLKFEQKKVFQRPFSNKSQENFLNLPVTCYRWGNPFAKNLRQTTWSEALHIFVHDIGKVDHEESLR
ncbi:putative gibberellin 2-beta-dioxygenase [Lupinus albus]|uniref:Putative gibberellin 2-beta-dioxygenase n=1 Tax=Lupinus albus TaxID=3870 RepID=A0A6A4NFL1_LUPAL|nr:putative gibberellin 2-beta-dioxygenase [Lupinus albus]